MFDDLERESKMPHEKSPKIIYNYTKKKKLFKNNLKKENKNIEKIKNISKFKKVLT